MPRTCAQRSIRWSPTLAAFALFLFAALTLATGTARADDGTSAAGSSGSSSSSQTGSSSHSGKPAEKTTSDTATSDKTTSEKTSNRTNPSDEPSDKTTSDETTTGKTRSDEATNGKTTSHETTPNETTPNDHDSSADPNTTGTVAATTSAGSKTAVDSADVAPTLSVVTAAKPSVPVEHHQDTAVRDVAVGALGSSPVDPDRQPNATSTLRLVAAATPQQTAPGKALAPVGPYPGQRLQQSIQQLIGLVSDVGIVGASLVNNIAAQTALTIGPVPFWGLPYAISTGIAGTAGNISKVLSGTPLDATSVGPFAVNYGVLDVLSFFNPTKIPAGANDPSIGVSAAHPLPIILVNGTVETQNLDWSVGAPVLANAGYKVYTFNYGNPTPFPSYPIQSVTDIRQSAAELSAEVDRVLAETGAPKVILIGHSQGGGIMPAYYINNLDGADKVSQFVGLAPSNHGTDLGGLVGLQMLPIVGPLLFQTVGLIGPALIQQTVSSPFQDVVYGNGDTRDGIAYTTISTIHDEVVTPYTQQALVGPGVTNIVLQDRYPGLVTGHIGMAITQPAWAIVLEALSLNAEANPMQELRLTAA